MIILKQVFRVLELSSGTFSFFNKNICIKDGVSSNLPANTSVIVAKKNSRDQQVSNPTWLNSPKVESVRLVGYVFIVLAIVCVCRAGFT